MLDLTVETPVSLADLPHELPKRAGRKLHPSTGWRWCRRGIARGATKVTLEYCRIGRNIYTTKEALNRFFARLADADRDEDSSPIERAAAQCRTPVTTGKPRSAKRRAEDIARARRELAAAGV